MDARVSYGAGVEVIQLTLTRSELRLLSNAILASFEAIEDWEYSTRLGVDVSEARQVHREIRDVYRSLPPED